MGWDLYAMADELVGDVVDALAACGRPEAKHCGVVPSGGEFDAGFCCEGQVWARVLPSAPSVQGTVPDNCAEFGWSVVFEAGVARCPVRPDMSGLQPVQPTTDRLAAAAEGQLGDGQALASGVVAATSRWRGPWDDPEVEGWLDATVGQLSWVNGQCLGAVVQVRVTLVGWCCDEGGVAVVPSPMPADV